MLLHIIPQGQKRYPKWLRCHWPRSHNYSLMILRNKGKICLHFQRFLSRNTCRSQPSLSPSNKQLIILHISTWGLSSTYKHPPKKINACLFASIYIYPYFCSNLYAFSCFFLFPPFFGRQKPCGEWAPYEWLMWK